MQFCTHCGSPLQRLHFAATCLLLSKWILPNGHAGTHILQPTQAASSTTTALVLGSRKSPSVGQTSRQSAVSHCRHVMVKMDRFPKSTCTQIFEFSRLKPPVSWNEQTRSQFRQARHRSSSTKITFILFFLFVRQAGIQILTVPFRENKPHCNTFLYYIRSVNKSFFRF